MNRRLVSTTFLSMALIFAQGGSFLIAALCPHLRTGVMRCDMPAQQSVMDHHDMADMQMDHESGSLTPKAANFDQPSGTCTHCAVHSRTTSGVFYVRHVEAAKRATDLIVPLIFEYPTPLTVQVHELVTARSHGPPGDTNSRHILISVFRI